MSIIITKYNDSTNFQMLTPFIGSSSPNHLMNVFLRSDLGPLLFNLTSLPWTLNFTNYFLQVAQHVKREFFTFPLPNQFPIC